MDPDMMIFWGVVLARLLTPLAIPRFPLPGVIAALVLDAVDQTIFQQFTSLNLESYQSYDKALDIYYLTIAYISTLRNWTNLFAYRVSRFLLYYRLVGVVLFELTQIRTILLIFPNTFEYFFIFYEAVRLRWNPKRLSRKMVLGATAFIWIFIKLPQEYWLHVAQNDVTEMLNVYLLGEPADAPIVQSFLRHPEILIPLLIIVAGLLVLGWWVVTRKLPQSDWKLALSADAHVSDKELEKRASTRPVMASIWNGVLVEKVGMVALVSVIFGQILPGVRVTGLQLVVGVALVIAINAGLSHWLQTKGKEWASLASEFLVMALTNFGLALVYLVVLPRYSGTVNIGNVMFFALLLTLLVVLFDRYHPYYIARLTHKR